MTIRLRQPILTVLFLALVCGGMVACGSGSEELTSGAGNDGGLDPSSGVPPTTAPTDGPVEEPEPETPPEETNDDPPVVAPVAAFTAAPSEPAAFGQVERNTEKALTVSLKNNTTTERTAVAYLLNSPIDLALVDANGVATTKWTGTVPASGTALIPLAYKATTLGNFTASLLITIPDTNDSVSVDFSGNVMGNIFQLTSPSKTLYLHKETTVRFSGNVTDATAFSASAAVSFEIKTTDQDNKVVTETASTTLQNGSFAHDLPIAAAAGRYDVKLTIKDKAGKSYSLTRVIYREAAPKLELLLKNASRTEINPYLTDADPLVVAAKIPGLNATGGLITATVSVNNVAVETSTLTPGVSDETLYFSIAARDRFKLGKNIVTVKAWNRAGEIEKTASFIFNTTLPKLVLESPRHLLNEKTPTGFIALTSSDITDKGLLVRGLVSGIDPLLNALDQLKPVTQVGGTNRCADNSAETVTVQLPIPEDMRDTSSENPPTTFSQIVNPCPVEIYINGIEGSTPIRIQPNKNGTFFAFIPKEVRNNDEKKSLTRGYRFGVNTLLVKSANALNHSAEDSFTFQIGNIAEGHFDGDKAVFPTAHQALTVHMNTELFRSLEAPVETYMNTPDENGYGFLGNYFASMTDGMAACIRALNTPFFDNDGNNGNAGGDVYKIPTFLKRYQNDTLPDACTTIQDGDSMSVIDKYEDAIVTNLACIGTPNCLENDAIGIKPSWPKGLFFANRFDDIGITSNDKLSGMLRKNGDYTNSDWIKKSVREGKWDVLYIKPKANNHFAARIRISDIHSPALFVQWAHDDAWGTGSSYPYVFPIVMDLDALEVTVEMSISETGHIRFLGEANSDDSDLSDVVWKPNTSRCQDGTYAYGKREFALGCGDKPTGFLLDTSTDYGVEFFMVMEGTLNDRAEFDAAMKDKNDAKILDEHANFLTGILADSFKLTFDELLCRVNFDNNRAWCDSDIDDGDVNLASMLEEVGILDDLVMNASKLEIASDDDGLTLDLFPQFTGISTEIPDTLDGKSFPSVYRDVPLPMIPDFSGQAGFFAAIPEELINQAFSTLNLNGFGKLIDENTQTPYEFFVSEESLCSYGITPSDLESYGVSLDAGFLLGTQKQMLALNLRFPPFFAPTVAFEHSDQKDEVVVGVSGIAIDMFDATDTSKLVASFDLSTALRFDTSATSGKSIELRLNQAESYIQVTVSKNNTSMTYPSDVRENLQRILNTFALGKIPCLQIVLPDSYPDGDFKVLTCGDNDDDGFIGEDAGGDDCDDSDATIYPDAPQIRDGKDHNCDGSLDQTTDPVTTQPESGENTVEPVDCSAYPKKEAKPQTETTTDDNPLSILGIDQILIDDDTEFTWTPGYLNLKGVLHVD